jgi:hypothetical protein
MQAGRALILHTAKASPKVVVVALVVAISASA